MKKAIFTTIAILLIGWAGQTKAQDCDAILQPLYTLLGTTADEYPADKAADRCAFSHNAFYLTNDLPHGATIFRLTELTDKLTGLKVTEDFTVDLNTLCYYQYNFNEFQREDYYRTIYFQIGPRSRHEYLAVRCYDETWRRTYYPEEFNK